ncbi:(2E,6E)-farnesyl diphosphate synthase [Paraferrimonas sedimenticola]|uniref:(2E,6E)-farnesyl diphosphate synthase n=1 Tax=Paraferrimonas sedimenticola TaxID=375674 RepID=A0AA37RXU1_9GAMM|nr:(2E,6E)-farnesyl diphosphate synthase [Paraferrimonas sedimenticola]GLP96809.1 (2E,6E)-farnesyl diphosphate synthase [Paraferrimonas sedimenticola]
MSQASLELALGNAQTRVNQGLANAIDGLVELPAPLKAAMRHGVLLGGKRVRPFLVYAIGETLGVPVERLDNAAMALECIHAYSLIHDDLPAMDDDELRRGQPTVHIAFDEATGILAGDALQSLAFELISADIPDVSPQQQLALTQALAKAAGYSGMCGGQAMDLAATAQHVELDTLMQLHRLKTGALIECAARMACIIANADANKTTAFAQYSQHIGLAFQVHDDVLDIVGNTEELGKPQGSDLAADKSTYPQLLGLEGAQQTARKLVQQALTSISDLPYNCGILEAFAQFIIERKQ